MGKRILVVDDEPVSLKLFCDVLTMRGFDVVEAVDGPGALDAARSEAPDLMLLDIQLPGLSGIEVAQQLRADPQTKDLLIVAVTAAATTEECEYAERNARFDALVTKPVALTELLELISSLIGE